MMPFSHSFSLPTAPQCLRFGTFNIGRGLRRKLPSLLTRCTELRLDAVALQETGDPALLSNQSQQRYTLIYAAGPGQQEAGVALLLSTALLPAVRNYLRSSTGRLLGAVLELCPGHRLLLVSVYLPSGLDHRPLDSPEADTARKVYAELHSWTVGMHSVIVAGDLNETLTPQDRQPQPPRPLHPSGARPIDHLLHNGYLDLFRSCYPDASTRPGFTHFTSEAGSRKTSSRIDYFFARGLAATDVLDVRIDYVLKLTRVSTHCLLWALIVMSGVMSGVTPGQKPTAPVAAPQRANLQAASPGQRQQFKDQLAKAVQDALAHTDIADLESAQQPDAISRHAEHLAWITRECADRTLPQHGGSPRTPRAVRQCDQQRRQLTKLHHDAAELHKLGIPRWRCPAWCRLLSRCTKQYGLTWTVSPFVEEETARWLTETHEMITRVRSIGRKSQLQLGLTPQQRAARVLPAAVIHRMLQSDALPSQLHSVVRTDGSLTTSPDELQAEMVRHFEQVFAMPTADEVAAASPLPRAPPDMLYHKPGIDTNWYTPLMQPMDGAELLASMQDIPTASAPGEDEVSSPLWRVALEGCAALLELVIKLFNTCLRTATFPAAWKRSIIQPLIKDATKERTMSNVRPISLQCSLGKLFTRVLARRLANILAQHPILHPAQRGFVLGGSTAKCIDELLDAWDWSRHGNRELYTLFYDIAQAYDSVQRAILARAMQRIQLPSAFITLICDSLSHLQSRVRTRYGLTRWFEVQRSLRQGDPLSSLLFVILLDPLHCGLEQCPFTGLRHGAVLKWPVTGFSAELASLGYADDTTVLTTTLADLVAQNAWVEFFLLFNSMRLNATKCEIVGRDARGQPLTAATLAAYGLTISAVPPTPVPHERPIRYLGVHVCFNGDCRAQFNKARGACILFSRLVEKFALSVAQTSNLYTVFLLPKLELALHYACGAGTTPWLKSCDRILVGAIKRATKSPLQLSLTAVALTSGFALPSWMEAVVKVSELFLRLNSTDDRWAAMGRAVVRSQGYASARPDPASRPRIDAAPRLARAVLLATCRLNWSSHLTEERAPLFDGARVAAAAAIGGRGRREHHLFDTPPAGPVPEPRARSSYSLINPPALPLAGLGDRHDRDRDALAVLVAQDVLTGFGASSPAHTIHVYIGASSGSSGTVTASAWGVVVRNRWLVANHRRLPIEDKALGNADTSAAAQFGCAISVSTGVYAAEVQGVARALAMLPLSCHVVLHCAGESPIAAIQAWEQQHNERKRYRMVARPLLALIAELRRRRVAAGGSCAFQHVPADAPPSDIEAVGVRLARVHASRCSLAGPARSQPRGLQQFPMAACEEYLALSDGKGSALTDDIRHAALITARTAALRHWASKIEAASAQAYGLYAGQGMLDLSRCVRASGSPSQQATLIHIATNSIHFLWIEGREGVQTLRCVPGGDDVLDLAHLTHCPHPHGWCGRFRADLLRAVVLLLDSDDDSRKWLARNRHRATDLPALLTSLFLDPEPRPAPEHIDPIYAVVHHPTLCMIGAFTHKQSATVARTLGLKPDAGGSKGEHALLRRFRLLALTHITAFYSHCKAQSQAPPPA